MVTIYTSPSCSSCRKVKRWFEEQKIPFEEKNIFTVPLDEKELMDILAKSDNGTDDIISPRSKIVKESKVNLDELSLTEMVKFIQENPSVLKRPILVDNRIVQVGYNPEDIESFIPMARRLALLECSANNCEKYGECDHRKDRDEI